MNQQNIIPQSEFQPVEEEKYFDTQPIEEEIPPVMPLDETPTRASRRFQRLRVPMRRENKSFNPVFLGLALLAVTALGVIAGTMVYRTSSENSSNSLAPGNSETRTVTPQYQFIVDKPETTTSSTTSKTETATKPVKNNTELPVTENLVTESEPEPIQKAPANKQRVSNATSGNADEQEKPAENEVVTEEKPAENESDEEQPPPLPSKNKERRKENQKREKPEQNNSRSNSENQESESISETGIN